MIEAPAEPTTDDKSELPRHIRVSVGTGVVLGLLNERIDAAPTTAYLMTYRKGKCIANCGFCPQARTSSSNTDLLSRVTWPACPTWSVLTHLPKAVRRGHIKRVCVQALNYPRVFMHLSALVRSIKSQITVPVSVSCQPKNTEDLSLLAEAGVDRVGIALDVASEQLFDRVKGACIGGPYHWRDEFKRLNEAVGIFGKGNVSTHLIVGLGETEKELVFLVQECADMGVLPALFAFTPIKGTALATCPKPGVDVYRRIQVARYLIVNGLARVEAMRFDNEGRVTDFGVSKPKLVGVVDSGRPFLTSGCPSCNRPFYNETPSGPLFNYPYSVSSSDLEVIKRDLKL